MTRDTMMDELDYVRKRCAELYKKLRDLEGKNDYESRRKYDLYSRERNYYIKQESFLYSQVR